MITSTITQPLVKWDKLLLQCVVSMGLLYRKELFSKFYVLQMKDEDGSFPCQSKSKHNSQVRAADSRTF